MAQTRQEGAEGQRRDVLGGNPGSTSTGASPRGALRSDGAASASRAAWMPDSASHASSLRPGGRGDPVGPALTPLVGPRGRSRSRGPPPMPGRGCRLHSRCGPSTVRRCRYVCSARVGPEHRRTPTESARLRVAGAPSTRLAANVGRYLPTHPGYRISTLRHAAPPPGGPRRRAKGRAPPRPPRSFRVARPDTPAWLGTYGDNALALTGRTRPGRSCRSRAACGPFRSRRPGPWSQRRRVRARRRHPPPAPVLGVALGHAGVIGN